MTDWTWVKEQSEGQFLERKSCYDRRDDVPRPRPVKDVIRDVAETLAAMANADGGTVVLGIEDDGTVSGVPERYNLAQVRTQIRSLIRPPSELSCS